MMRFLPQGFHSKTSKLSSIAFYSNLELVEVVSAIWIYLQDHRAIEKTADEVIKTVGEELYRKNHYDVRTVLVEEDDEKGAKHLSLFDLSQKDKISDLTPLDLLLKYEQKQQVNDFINANFGGSEDAALAHFGDTKALSELLHVSRRRAQQIIKKRRDENKQIDLFDGVSDSGGDE